MQAIVSNHLHIIGAPGKVISEIKTQLTIRNPQYVDAVKMGRWAGNLDEYLFHFEQPSPGELITPRGFISQLVGMAKQQGEPLSWTDRTRALEPVEFQFNGMLRPYQKEAATAILQRRFGQLDAATGCGKTVITLSNIAARRQPALIVVHTRELMNQWIDKIETFLGIPRNKIGIIGGGKMRIGERVTVGMVQSLYKCAMEVAPYIGFLVVDECHRCPSRTFTEAVTAFDSRFMLGLSATPFRRDQLTKLIYLYLGDRVHQISQKELTQNGAILPFRVKTVETDFRTDRDPSAEYSAMLSELTQDAERNRLVCSESARYAQSGGGIPLVLSDRKAHCEALVKGLKDYGVHADMLTGDLSAKERAEVVETLSAGGCEALVATGQLIGEGFDMPSLGAVLLATPIRFQGRVIQSIGRALRPSPGQEYATVVDFVDTHVGVLAVSARKRQDVYRSMGGC